MKSDRCARLLNAFVTAVGVFGATPARAEETSPPTPTPAAVKPPDDIRPFEIALFTPVNIFHPDRKVIYGVDLNIIYGKTTSTYGLEVGGIVNRELEDVGGLQVGGIVNYVSGDATGIQVGGILNYVGHDAGGLQVAGIFNDVDGNAWGLQVAPVSVTDHHFAGVQAGAFNAFGEGIGLQVGGLGNGVGKATFALQLAGLANIASGDSTAVQIGFMNDAEKDFTGAQLGAFNLANSTIPVVTGVTYEGNNTKVTHYSSTVCPACKTKGLQISAANGAQNFAGFAIGGFGNFYAKEVTEFAIGGLVNTSGDFSGVAIAGIANGAGDVHGVQIAAFNFAHKLSGAQIGVINIATENKLPFMVGFLPGL